MDFENVPKVDLSVLDGSVRAVIFVGKNQQPPKASRKKSTAHRFERVDFFKVEGAGRNSLDFHLAFHLGRIFETAPDTHCVVIAKDKGYDPLLEHLNKKGMKCRRVNGWDTLVAERPAALVTAEPKTVAPIVVAAVAVEFDPDLTVCGQCHKASTIEHYGGRWCSNCGRFASPPKTELLPSSQPWFARSQREREHRAPDSSFRATKLECSSCRNSMDTGDGYYDDGEWTCWACV